METRLENKLYVQNLDDLSEHEKSDLLLLLHEKAQSDNPYLLLETEVATFSLPPDVETLKTTVGLVGRASSKNPNHYHFDVYSLESETNFGEGHYGTVLPIVATLTILFDDKNYLELNKNKRRAGKWMPHTTGTESLFRSGINKEFNLTKRNIQIGAKPPTLIKTPDGTYAVMALNYLPDIDLRPTAMLSHLSELQRLRLVIAALLGQQTLEQNRIVHRDIKGENVRVTAAPYQATVVDFGLSRDSVQEDEKIVGTPLYSPPEFFKLWI
jgi:serine/threonine protein kinase